MNAQRIQRKRTRGWKMPANTVYVGRPTKWGNPFPQSDEFADWLEKGFYNYIPCLIEQREFILSHIHELKDKNMACWCPPGEECHADVLLKLANEVQP